MTQQFVTFSHVLSPDSPVTGVNLSRPVTPPFRGVTNVTNPDKSGMTTSQRFASIWDALPPGLKTAPEPLSGAQPTDTRATCQTCARLWRTPAGAHACTDHRRAGLTTRELALDFTHLAQNCPSWSAKP